MLPRLGFRADSKNARLLGVNRRLLAVAVLLGQAGAFAASDAEAGARSTQANERPPQLSLKLRNVRSSKGKVGCALFKGPKGFPLEPEAAARRLWCPIRGQHATCSVQEGLPAGRYAAVCIHDENGNGKLDTNWIGYPKEGVVASNHAKGHLGPPSFEDAAFEIRESHTVMRMRMGY